MGTDDITLLSFAAAFEDIARAASKSSEQEQRRGATSQDAVFRKVRCHEDLSDVSKIPF